MRRVQNWMPGIPKLLRLTLMAGSLTVLLAGFALAAKAQASGLEDGPPPPYAAETPAEQPAHPEKDIAAGRDKALPAEPAWDPLHASKSMEVGMFYKKKGNYDAAIERFQDAARLQPGLARPFLMLGEIYEKKRDPASAVTAYRKYLELYRTAPDREDVVKHIEKLEASRNRQAAREASR